jgi:2-oxoglutarate dehydrogenase E1 component
MEQMYVNWLEDPNSVHPSWNAYFINLNHQIPPESSFVSPETAQKQNMIPTGNVNLSSGFGGVSEDILNLKKMVKFFRNFGHIISDLDPLELSLNKFESQINMDKFELDYYFPGDKADKPISISGTDNILLVSRKSWTPRELFEHLKSVYCGKIAYSYHHISDRDIRFWVESRLEVERSTPVTKEVHEELLDTILESQAFSDFCTRKFSTLKRFGADGLDTGIVAIKELLNKFHECKGDQFILGMAHRGRLNTLPCVFKKPYIKMFIEFFDKPFDFIEDPVYDFYGDVKYHNGYSANDTHKSGNEMFIQMLPNPSHLEAVNPLVMGYARGKMDLIGDSDGDKVLPVLVHGDAALSGQGIIYETLQMEKLKGYSVGGTINLVFNNQVGFTTEPLDGRSGRYSTHIGKANENLIIMVNGDDPVKVREAVNLALDYRNKFKKDVFVDIIGYRKYGHNEQDNPRFTQPVMYKTIDAMKPMYQKYADDLVAKGIFTREEIDSKYDYFYNEVIDKQYEIVRNNSFDPSIYDLKRNDFSRYTGDGLSGINLDQFRELGEKLYTLDLPNFKVDNTVNRLYKTALKSISEGKGISWATAEHMAYASLLNEGHSVRLSGEDCERGTFSHRHAVLVDQQTNNKYFPLTKILPEERKGDLTIVNSLLSEYGVLGFDYGFSWARPDSLTIWEAQFGDFANGAQIIIDQFLMNSEKKWRRFSGLVMLLPHGYDGQGPEHSNARIERFLSNVDDNFLLAKESQEYRDNILSLTNIQVTNITLASNFFHILRNQVKRKERKPLVVMSPKKILMSREVQSDLEEFGPDRKFRPVLEDTNPKQGIKKVLICSGQIYFGLNNRRNKLGLNNEIAIIRLERIGPFAYNEFAESIKGYHPDTEFVFVSEEQYNFGAYSFVQPRVNMILRELGFNRELEYVGRKISGSSSTGIGWLHVQEIEDIMTNSIGEINE